MVEQLVDHELSREAVEKESYWKRTTIYHICIYIYIYREREIERERRKHKHTKNKMRKTRNHINN